jgi:membrane-bound lytic murein transglycosylase D
VQQQAETGEQPTPPQQVAAETPGEVEVCPPEELVAAGAGAIELPPESDPEAEEIPDVLASDIEPAPEPEPLSQQEEQALSNEPEIELHLDAPETEEFVQYFRLFTGTAGTKRSEGVRRTFARWLKRSEQYLPYIREVLKAEGLPEDLAFLPFAESGFNPRAYSRAGAAGMWQFMPYTGKVYGLKVDWWVDERRDPYKSTHAAAAYLKKLHGMFDDWYLALAAYNAGEGRISRELKRTGADNFFDMTAGPCTLHRETRNYVPKFMAILKIVKNAEALGFEPINYDHASTLVEIDIKGGSDLLALAKHVGLSWQEFSDLNPAFRRYVSPPEDGSSVHLPRSLQAKAESFLAEPGSRPYAGYQRYKIRSGDSWWRISRRSGVPVSVLKRVNKHGSNMLRPGQWVMIPSGGSTRMVAGPGDDAGPMTGAYTVRRGDSLWDIARRHGTTVSAIKRANAMHSSMLRPGQRLKVPGIGGSDSSQGASGGTIAYTVRSGDSLWDLARRHNTTVTAIKSASGISSSRLKPGQSLRIPSSSGASSATYKVRHGDTLWDIARRFGVSTSQLLAWNGLSKKSVIRPGDELTIKK